MKRLLLLSIMLLSLFSCENKAEALKKEIWVAHDEVMPKMSDLRLLRTRIDEMPDSIINHNDTLLVLAANLETADVWMMKWMREFDMKNEDEKYLSEELIKVNKMKSYFEKSLNNAKIYFNNMDK